MSQNAEEARQSTAQEKYTALVPHPTTPAVWLVPMGNGWALPEFIPAHEVHNWELPPARLAIREQVGVDATVRYALRLFEPALPGALNIHVLERPAAGVCPLPSGRWIVREELVELTMPLPKQRAVLCAWFADGDGEPLPALDIPWWREGWLAEVEGWLSAQVERWGYSPAGPAERLKGTVWSEVVRVPARPADLYLKALPRPFAHEAALLTRLAGQYPDRIPTLVGSEPERRWLVMRDMGGRSLGSDVPIERWVEAAHRYGQLQVEAAARSNQWLALGCPDLRLERLGEEIEALLAHLPERLRGLSNALSAEELAGLRALVPAWLRAVEALSRCGIPMSLEHGDLNIYNIRVTHDGPVFFDWSHACLTHPFFGLGDLIEDDDWFPEQSDFRERVRDAYLEAWTGVQPPEELRTAYRLSQPVRGLYLALHQNRVTAAFQEMLGGQDYLPETPTGNWLQYLQWWLAHHLQKLLRPEGPE